MKKFVFVNTGGFNEEVDAFEESDFIDTSSGSGDSGKPVKLDANGLLNDNMIPPSSTIHDIMVDNFGDIIINNDLEFLLEG